MTSARMQAAGCTLIAAVLEGGNNELLDVYAHVYAVMDAFPGADNVLMCACDALHNIIAADKLRTALISSDCVQRLMNVAAKTDNPEVCAEAMRALTRVVYHRHQGTARTELLDCILQAMSRFPRAVWLQACACSTFTALVGRDKEMQHAAVAAGGLLLLTAALATIYCCPATAVAHVSHKSGCGGSSPLFARQKGSSLSWFYTSGSGGHGCIPGNNKPADVFWTASHGTGLCPPQNIRVVQRKYNCSKILFFKTETMGRLFPESPKLRQLNNIRGGLGGGGRDDIR